MSLRRKGSSLIEVMILVSTTSAMLLLAISFIERTLAWSGETTAISNELRTSQQLTTQFDVDIRSAISAEMMSVNELKLVLRDQKVILYKAENSTVDRIQKRPPANDETPSLDAMGVTTLQERFTFSEDRVPLLTADPQIKCYRIQLTQTAVDLVTPKTLWIFESYLSANSQGDQR